MAMSRGNNYSISMNANLDMSQAQKTYNEFVSSKSRQKLELPLDLKLDNIIPKLDSVLNNKIGRKIDETFDRINTKVQTVRKAIETIGENGKTIRTFQNLTKVTETFKNDIGDVQERVSFWGEKNEYLASSLQTIQKGVTDLSTETNVYYKRIDDLAGKVTEVTKTITDSDGVEKQITKTTTEWVDANGRLNQSIVTTNEKGEQLSAVVKNITNDTRKAAKFMKEFSDATTKVSTIKNTDTSTIISKDGTKTIIETVNGVQQLKTVIKEYRNEQNQLVTETKKYKGVEEELISVDTKRNQNIKEEKEERAKLLNEISAEIQKKNELKQAQEKLNKALVSTTTSRRAGITTQWGDTSGKQYNALITTIRQVDKDGKVTIKTIEEFTNAQGKLVQQTRVTDENLKKVVEDEQKISDATNNASKSTQNFATSTKQAANDTKTFGQSLSDAMSRLVKYTVAMLPIQAVRNAISETTVTLQEFDSALIEFRKVSDLAGESLTRYVAKLAEMGEITGSTMQAMVEASTEFRKSGFTDEDSAKLAVIAEKYRNIADEEISAGESASFIIAQMKAFNIEADQAEHIIDGVNEVANNFSVSSADLATNLGNMSAIMAINNVSMEEQIGMLTGVTEITRNASSASRGLVMVSSRLTQVLDESSSTGKKLTKIYNDLGIELKDESGQLRSHYDILGDLAGQWDNLSENEQKYIALTSAGARQQQNFVALMENWNQVAKATATAYQSMGSAQKENEKVMDSIAKKVEILKSQFQQLVIGEGGLQEFAKTILDVGIKLLKFANSDIGKFTIALLAAEKGIHLLVGNFGTLVEAFRKLQLIKVIKDFSNLKDQINAAKLVMQGEIAVLGETTTSTLALNIAQQGLAKGIWATTEAWLASPMGAATVVVAALAGLTYATYKWANRINDAKEELKELSEQSDETENEIDNLEEALHNVRDSIKKVNEKKLKITDTDQLEKLQAETKELENQELILQNQLELAQQRLALEHEAEEKQAIETYNTKQVSHYKTMSTGVDNTDASAMGSGAGGITETYVQTNAREELAAATAELEKNTEARNRNIRLQQQNAREIKTYTQQLEEEKRVHGENTETYQVLQEKLNNATNSYNEHQKAIDSANEKIKVAKEVGLENAETLNQVRGSLRSNSEEANTLKKEIDDTTNAWNNANNQAKETKDNLDGVVVSTDEAADATDDLNDELEEELDPIEELANAHGVAVDQLKDWAKELKISEQELVDYADRLGYTVEEAYKLKAAFGLWNDEIDSLQSAFGTLTSAVEEYNENQYLSLDTIQDLLALSPEYLGMLSEENGQLVLNKEKILDKCNALIEEQKQNAISTAIERLRKLEIGESSAAEIEHKNKTYDNIDALREETDALYDNAKAYATKIAIESNGKKKGAADQIMADLDAELAILKKVGNSFDAISSKSSRAGRSGSSGAKSAKDAQKELNKELEETIKKYEQVIKYINKRYDREIKKIKDAKSEAVKAEEKKIKAVEKEKDHALDAIEKQIKALKKEQDARKQYWSDRIDALKKQNDALKDSLELQEKLDALEKARNTRIKIYKEGQGFVYDVDQTAVAKAQKELDEYLSQKAYEDELERLEALKDAELDNYEKRLDALNEYKDSVQENYEKQIEQMNEYKDQLSEQYDAQIDKWEEYKEQFGDLVDQYEEQQNKLLFEQLMGIKDENSNWLTRLDNLAEFVRKYNELQNKLNTGDTSVTNTAKMKEGTGSGTGSSNRTGSVKDTSSSSKDRWGTTLDVANKATKQPKYDSRGFKLNYASGTPSIKDDQIAVVGENPNKEIVIGSKINNGELMNLGKGTGVVNADSSKTLAGMLNQVGQFGASGFGSGNGTLNSNINNDTLTINGVTIQGSNIKDPETFVNGLLNLKAEALQRAYRHR